MPTPRKPSTVSTVLAKFAQMIKGTDQSALDDVCDILDDASQSKGDLWQRDGAPMSQSESNTGSAERMSGDGVKPMIGRYSEPLTQSTSGGDFAAIGDKLDSLERTVKALLGYVFKADVEDDEDRFPDSEAKSESEDDDDKDEVEKSDITKLSVSDLMSVLTNRASKKANAALKAQEARDGVRVPPDMASRAALAKSAYDLLDESDNMSMVDRLNVRIKLNAKRLKAEGMTGIDNHDARFTGAGASITGLASRG